MPVEQALGQGATFLTRPLSAQVERQAIVGRGASSYPATRSRAPRVAGRCDAEAGLAGLGSGWLAWRRNGGGGGGTNDDSDGMTEL